MITDRHSLQSPVAVPSYRSTRKNHRLFNVMREAVVSCTRCRLAILLDLQSAALEFAHHHLGTDDKSFAFKKLVGSMVVLPTL